MTPAALRDALARVVRALEALEDGDLDLARALLERLEEDLAAALDLREAA